MSQEALEEKPAGWDKRKAVLPDAVNHRSLQDTEEPVLLGVLWSLLHFPPRGGWWREGGEQVSRLQDNVLVILPAVME